MPVHRVVADQHHGAIGEQVVEQEPDQGAAQRQPGPRGAGQDAAVVGGMTGGQLPEGPQHIGDGASAGGEDGSDQQGGDALVGGVGEVQGQNLDERVRLGW